MKYWKGYEPPFPYVSVIIGKVKPSIQTWSYQVWVLVLLKQVVRTNSLSISIILITILFQIRPFAAIILDEDIYLYNSGISFIREDAGDNLVTDVELDDDVNLDGYGP
jgi:hypothetical protein